MSAGLRPAVYGHTPDYMFVGGLGDAWQILGRLSAVVWPILGAFMYTGLLLLSARGPSLVQK